MSEATKLSAALEEVAMHGIAVPALPHQEAAERAPQLIDEDGVPYDSCDSRLTNVHGQPIQPEANPDVPYQQRLESEQFARERAQNRARVATKGLFTRHEVELVRIRVALNWARSIVTHNVKDVAVMHLWFPVAGDIMQYEMRHGNPPPDSARPPHLKGHQLVIDCRIIPEHVRDVVRSGGMIDQQVAKWMQAHPNPNVSSGLALQAVLASLAETFAKRMQRARTLGRHL